MERIIEFLLDNIILIVIVLGVLSRLLGGSGSKKGNRPARMPDFGGGPGDSPAKPANRRARPAEVAGDKRGAESAEPVSAQRRPQPALAVERRPADEEPFARTIAGSFSRPAVAQAQSGKPSKQPSPEASPLKLSTDANELRRAVLWAEVLGPPRSKKPYRK